VRLVALEKGQPVVFLVQFSESDIKYCAHGTLYKFALLERPKISKVWGSYHNFHLAHPILIRPVALKREHIRGLQNEISDSEGPKFQRYTKRKLGQKDRLQIDVFKMLEFQGQNRNRNILLILFTTVDIDQTINSKFLK
jgi:hypothetical protein